MGRAATLERARTGISARRVEVRGRAVLLREYHTTIRAKVVGERLTKEIGDTVAARPTIVLLPMDASLALVPVLEGP